MRNSVRAAAGLVVSLVCFAPEIRADSGPVDLEKYTGPVRVACVGDSITFGVGTKTRSTESYPAQLGAMLGEKWEVKNFGSSGATMLNKGNRPYTQQKQHAGALKYNPQVVVIMLGTNDSKPENWKFKEEFTADTRSLVKEFEALPTKPRIFLCDPTPSPGGGNLGISDGPLLEEQPMIAQVAKEEGADVIDMHAALLDKPQDFPDRIHPNVDGASTMAVTAFHALTGKTYSGPLPAKKSEPATQPAAPATQP